MSNVIKDVSILSSIPEKTLNKLLDKVVYSIAETIVEDVNSEKEISELDLGIGVLYIKHTTADDIRYKFVPSESFEKTVNNTVTKKLNLLEDVLTESLSKKFLNVYKDIC